MPWRPHGRARVDPQKPQGWSSCDRCGFNYNLVDLSYQFQWAGTDLINQGIKVCSTCLDVPSDFLRTIIIPPDPEPLDQPRPEPYAFDEVDYRVTEESDLRVTENDEPRVIDSTGSETYTNTSNE